MKSKWPLLTAVLLVLASSPLGGEDLAAINEVVLPVALPSTTVDGSVATDAVSSPPALSADPASGEKDGGAPSVSSEAADLGSGPEVPLTDKQDTAPSNSFVLVGVEKNDESRVQKKDVAEGQLVAEGKPVGIDAKLPPPGGGSVENTTANGPIGSVVAIVSSVATPAKEVTSATEGGEVTQQSPVVAEPVPAADSDASEPAAPVISPSGDIDTFSDWTKKKLEAVAKERESSVTAGSSNGGQPSSSGATNGKGAPSVGSSKMKTKKRNRKNFASSDCGAKVLGSNPEAQSASAILSSGMDEYFLSPCKVKNNIYFVIELCEAIQPSRLEIGIFELYSSLPKEFVVALSDRYPTRDWTQLGKFEARDERGTQNFTIMPSPHVFGKYIKVDILSHFGSEHFCPISMFKVYGTSELEAMEQINVDSHVALDHGHGASLYALDEDEYIDDGDDEVEPDLPKPKNLFGSAKEAVMSIVKKAAEAFSAGGPQDGSKDAAAAETASRDVDDGDQGVLAGWPGRCACPSRRVPAGVSGEAWDAYSCARPDSNLADATPKSWQPCFDSLRSDVDAPAAGVGANGTGSASACTCSPISRLFAMFLTKDQILSVAVAEAFKVADLNASSVENSSCDGGAEVVNNVTLTNRTVSGGSEDIPVRPQKSGGGVVENREHVGEVDTKKPAKDEAGAAVKPTTPIDGPVAYDGVAPTPVVDGHVEPTSTRDAAASAAARALATETAASDGRGPPEGRLQSKGGAAAAPSLSPSSTSLPTVASFPDPGEGLPPSSEPTESVGFVFVPPPAETPSSSPPQPAAPSPVVPAELEEVRPATSPPVAPPTATSTTPPPTEVQVPSPPPEGSSGPATPPIDGDFGAKLEVGASPPYVALPASSLPPGNKETAFWRLSNKVKALELNLTLSSLYLEELSQSYKRQVEDLTKAVNKYQQQMNNYTSLIQGLVSKVDSLSSALDQTTRQLEAYESSPPVPMWLFVFSQTLLVVALSMMWTCRRDAARRAPSARGDPTVTPAVIRPARMRTATTTAAVADPGSGSARKPSYAWVDQPVRAGIVCGRAQPASAVFQNGGVGHSPSRTLHVMSGRSRAPSSSGDEGGQRRFRVVSGSEGFDLSPKRVPSSSAVGTAAPSTLPGGLNRLRPSSGVSSASSSSSPAALVLLESTNLRPATSPARLELPPKACGAGEPPATLASASASASGDHLPSALARVPSLPPTSDQSPSKLIRRHSFTCKEDAGRKWSVAGGRSRVKASAAPAAVAAAAVGGVGKKKQHRKKHKSSWDLNANGSLGTSASEGRGESRDAGASAAGGVRSGNRWFVLDSEDVRI